MSIVYLSYSSPHNWNNSTLPHEACMRTAQSHDYTHCGVHQSCHTHKLKDTVYTVNKLD